MSARKVPTIELTCDAPGCKRYFRMYGAEDWGTVRSAARLVGWAHDSIDKLDWCPEHAKEKKL